MLEDEVEASALATVYSSQQKNAVSPGEPLQFARKQYWLVEKTADGPYTIQPLNVNKLPSGTKREISPEELEANYTAEPQFYSQIVEPRMKELDTTLDRADDCREKGESFSAEFEYTNALELDEENIRAQFGVGLTSLALGELGKADQIFHQLLEQEGTFAPQHKHLFNDFGISLRKKKMYKQSISFYSRALELCSDDENLHINIARPLYEQRSLSTCLKHLFEALRIAPGNLMALRFIAWLEKGNYIPRSYREKVKKELSAYDITDIPPLSQDTGEEESLTLPEELDGKLSTQEPEAVIELTEEDEEELANRQKVAAHKLQVALQEYVALKGMDIVLPKKIDEALQAERGNEAPS